MAKPTKWHVRPMKTQISQGICPVWSESSLSAWRNLGSLATHWAHSKDSDQTGRMPRLIRVFAGHTLILLVLSCCGSILFKIFRRQLLGILSLHLTHKGLLYFRWYKIHVYAMNFPCHCYLLMLYCSFTIIREKLVFWTIYTISLLLNSFFLQKICIYTTRILIENVLCILILSLRLQ